MDSKFRQDAGTQNSIRQSCLWKTAIESQAAKYSDLADEFEVASDRCLARGQLGVEQSHPKSCRLYLDCTTS